MYQMFHGIANNYCSIINSVNGETPHFIYFEKTDN